MPVHSIRNDNYTLFLFDDFTRCPNGHYLNASDYPYDYELQSLLDIVDTNPDEKFYISPAGCAGILRRKREHNDKIKDFRAQLRSVIDKKFFIFRLVKIFG